MAQNSTKREAQSAVNHGVDALQHLPSDAVDAIRELVREVRDETMDLVQAGRDQVSELGDRAGGAIRGNPLQSIAIAVGAGIMIGLMMRRR